MSATPIQPVDEEAVPRPRTWPLFDPVLLLAALGVVACSLITLRGATNHAVTGQPFHYVDRQALFAGISSGRIDMAISSITISFEGSATAIASRFAFCSSGTKL